MAAVEVEIGAEDAEWCPAGAAGWSWGGGRWSVVGESAEKRRKRYNIDISRASEQSVWQ